MIAQWGLGWSLQVRRARLERARQKLLFRKQMLDQRSKLVDSYHKLIKEQITSLGTLTDGGGDDGDQYDSSED